MAGLAGSFSSRALTISTLLIAILAVVLYQVVNYTWYATVYSFISEKLKLGILLLVTGGCVFHSMQVSSCVLKIVSFLARELIIHLWTCRMIHSQPCDFPAGVPICRAFELLYSLALTYCQTPTTIVRNSLEIRMSSLTDF